MISSVGLQPDVIITDLNLALAKNYCHLAKADEQDSQKNGLKPIFIDRIIALIPDAGRYSFFSKSNHEYVLSVRILWKHSIGKTTGSQLPSSSLLIRFLLRSFPVRNSPEFLFSGQQLKEQSEIRNQRP